MKKIGFQSKQICRYYKYYNASINYNTYRVNYTCSGRLQSQSDCYWLLFIYFINYWTGL